MDDSRYAYDYDSDENKNKNLDLIDAINAAIEFKVVQIGQVKIETTIYDLYRTISTVPLYLINETNRIKIIGIYTLDYEIIKS